MQTRHSFIRSLMPRMADDGGTDGGAGTATADPIGAATADAGSGNTNHVAEISPFVGDDGSQNTNATFEIPEEYKEKGWAVELTKNGNPQVEIFKQFDNLQTLLGKRPPAIPGENATEEEIAAFNKAVGVPEKPDDYELKTPEWGEEEAALGEALGKLRNEGFESGVKELFLKAGLTPRQAAVLSEGYDRLVVKNHTDYLKSLAETAEAENRKFDELATAEFGERKNKVLENGKALLLQHAPEKFHEGIQKLDSESLVILSAVLDGITQKYIKEDSLPTGRGSVQGYADEASFREEQRKKMVELAKLPITSPERDRLQKEVDDNYAKFFGTNTKK